MISYRYHTCLKILITLTDSSANPYDRISKNTDDRNILHIPAVKFFTWMFFFELCMIPEKEPGEDSHE